MTTRSDTSTQHSSNSNELEHVGFMFLYLCVGFPYLWVNLLYTLAEASMDPWPMQLLLNSVVGRGGSFSPCIYQFEPPCAVHHICVHIRALSADLALSAEKLTNASYTD